MKRGSSRKCQACAATKRTTLPRRGARKQTNKQKRGDCETVQRARPKMEIPLPHEGRRDSTTDFTARQRHTRRQQCGACGTPPPPKAERRHQLRKRFKEFVISIMKLRSRIVQGAEMADRLSRTPDWGCDAIGPWETSNESTLWVSDTKKNEPAAGARSRRKWRKKLSEVVYDNYRPIAPAQDCTWRIAGARYKYRGMARTTVTGSGHHRWQVVARKARYVHGFGKDVRGDGPMIQIQGGTVIAARIASIDFNVNVAQSAGRSADE